MAVSDLEKMESYWQENLKLMRTLLIIWFLASFGCGVLLVDILNSIQIGGFKLGFWFAQQGSIYIFLVLIFYYVYRMNKLDEKYNFQDD